MSEYQTFGPDGPENTGTVERAKDAAADTAQTAKDQARNVGSEMKDQAGQAVHRLRGRVRDEADSQSRRAAQSVRKWADDLTTMTDNGKPDSPVHGVLQQVTDTGHRAADYLEERGIGGVASDVQDFARRRPAVFLVGALAAGFVATRIAKVGAKAAQDDTPGSTASPTQPRPAAGGSAYDPVTPVTRYPDQTGTPSPYAADPASGEPYQSVTHPADYRGGEPR